MTGGWLLGTGRVEEKSHEDIISTGKQTSRRVKVYKGAAHDHSPIPLHVTDVDMRYEANS